MRHPAVPVEEAARRAWPGFSVLIAFGRLGPFRVYRETHRLAILLGWVSIDFFTVDAKSMFVEQSRAIKKIMAAGHQEKVKGDGSG